MHQTRVLIPAILAATLLFACPAFAGGWGPYFSWSHDIPKMGFPGLVIDKALDQASGFLTPSQINSLRTSMQAAELKFEMDHLSFGVIYDSAPSWDQLFNFRMTLGPDFTINGKATGITFPPTGNPYIDNYVHDASGYVASILDTTGYGATTKFTFGFSPIRNEILKWWLGPCVRLNGNYYHLDVAVPTFGRLKHGGSVGLGGGIETGINFHVTSFMSIDLTGGFLWNAYGLGAAVEDTTGTLSNGTFVWGNGPMFMLQVSALFHTGDDRAAWQ
jgi:hypothetical protein